MRRQRPILSMRAVASRLRKGLLTGPAAAEELERSFDKLRHQVRRELCEATNRKGWFRSDGTGDLVLRHDDADAAVRGAMRWKL